MTMTLDSARNELLQNARIALGRRADSPIASIPSSARVAPRQTGDANSEIEMLLGEIAKLGGNTRRISHRNELSQALEQLVQIEQIKKAACWQTRELMELGIEESLRGLGVEIVSPHSDKRSIAECDLGVTSVDAALPETGTLILRSSPERPRMVSLVPRAHLAIIRSSALRADLAPALAELKGEGYWVFVTGPSRTSDIELTVTIGVHGPKALYVWNWEG